MLVRVVGHFVAAWDRTQHLDVLDVSALRTVRGEQGDELKFHSFNATSAEDGMSLGKSNRPDAVPLLRKYAFVAGCVAVGFLVRYLLTPMLGEELPFLLFIAAALVAAWYGGAVCGLAALALGLFLGDSIFLHRNTAPQPVIVVRLIRYIFTASLGVGLIEVLHRSKSCTEATMEKLKQEVERRKRSENLLLEAEVKLHQRAQGLEHRVEEQTEKLSATVKSVKNLLYFIAHNFRAPLRAMEGYASLLMNDCATNLDPSTKN